MPEAQLSARKQRRGLETRRQLIESTKSLLAGRDYQSVTLDQISKEVGVAKSSILWHFGSKEALLTEAVYDLFDEIDRAISLEKQNLPSIDDRIEHLLSAIGAYHTDNPGAKGIVLSLMFSNKSPDAIRTRIREQWQDHISKIREFLSGDDALVGDDYAAAILALVHGNYLQWFLDGNPDDLAKRLLATHRALSESNKRRD